jgi:hypothetical protein
LVLLSLFIYLNTLADMEHMFDSIPTFARPVRRYDNVLNQLLQLDSWAGPWLSETEFRSLFAKCPCGLVMTRKIFEDHVCARPAVIDLTGDSDDMVDSESDFE